jgi:hypothetical protein
MKVKLLIIAIFLILTNTNAQGWGQIQKVVPDDRFAGQQFGFALAIDGNFAVVGVKEGNGQGEAYVFENDGNGNWIQLQKLESPTPHQFAHFGSAVAINGDYILIGSWGNHYDANGNNFVQGAGAAYIFKKQTSGNFIFEQKIVASNRETNNHFGFTLALNGDYAIVGTLRDAYDVEGNNYLANAGAAFIFERDGSGTWNEVQKIVASDRDAEDFFAGDSITIEGNYAVVGAKYEDEDETGMNILESAGSAYIFERDGSGTWNEVQKIVASGREFGEWFGSAVSISGNVLIVGASNEYLVGNTAAQYGAVYVFERDGSGNWNEVQKIRPSYLEHLSKFGNSLDIEGNTLIVGAYLMSIGSIGDGGAAFMFEKDGAGIWNQVAEMYDSDVNSSDYFGYKVAISGENAIVGAYKEDEDENGENFLGEAGSAYIFDVNQPNTLSPLNTLSIDGVNLETPFVVYPNPAINYITISSTTQIKNIQLYDLLGKRVLQTTKTNTIQVNHLAKGMYLLKIVSEERQLVKKIIIK